MPGTQSKYRKGPMTYRQAELKYAGNRFMFEERERVKGILTHRICVYRWDNYPAEMLDAAAEMRAIVGLLNSDVDQAVRLNQAIIIEVP